MNNSVQNEIERIDDLDAEDFRARGDTLLLRARCLARQILERAHTLMRATDHVDDASMGGAEVEPRRR